MADKLADKADKNERDAKDGINTKDGINAKDGINDKSEISDKSERNDKSEINDKAEIAGMSDIADRIAEIAKIAKIAKSDKGGKGEKSGVVADEAEKAGKKGESEKSEKPEKSGEADIADRIAEIAKIAKIAKSDKGGKDEKSGVAADGAENAEKSGEADIADRIAEIARIAKGGKDGKSEKNSVAAADEAGRAGESGEADIADESSYKRVGRSGSRRRTFVSVLVLVLLVSFAAAAYVLTEKEIELVDNGNSVFVKTHAATVADLLEQQEIVLGEEDEVSPTAETELADGDLVSVHRAFAVSVSADFKTESFLTQPVTVAEFLTKNGVEVGEYDWVSPGKDSVVTPETSVVINRITYRQTQTTEEIKPKKVRKNDSTLNVGQSRVVTEGVSGERLITNLVTYKDGVPIAKQELSRVVAKAAQDEVLAVGTRKVISRGGKEYVYTDVYTMKATAYTHTGNKTASGTWPSPGFTVAVDPDFIPLGTRLYVDGYGYAKAEDTGGRISGKRIDIFLNTEKECLNWGVRNVRVYILD